MQTEGEEKAYRILMCEKNPQSYTYMEIKCNLFNSLSVNQWCELWQKKVQVPAIKCTSNL